MRGQPLAVRLAVVLAAVVVVVLILAGVVVNRAVSRSLDETLGPREQQRLALAVTVIEEGLERGTGRGIPMLVRRVANETGGSVRVLDAAGAVLFEAGGRPGPDGERETITADLSDEAGGGSVEIEVPSARAPFLSAFNGALLLTGVVAVGALLAAAAFVAARVTRPLRGVAAAAHRLGDGDLAARAEGGPDAESQELAEAFNDMAERLQRSETLRRRAASDLAHDLATPATVLESQLQAMVDGVVPANGAELEKARTAAAALSGVIVQLGELTHAEAAPLQRRAETIDLDSLIREIVAGLEGMVRDRDVTVSVTGAAGPIQADRGHLARALRNVVINAIQHSPSGTEVSVTLSDAPGRAVVQVRDHGAGIADEDLPHVFERFYRADRARGAHGGSGIGLTVARELIAANGGSVEVESTGPGGTTFRIVLPRDA
ncbi:MAG TPA: HAMP domain-containing sensor histidine kinase [Patescibacteria group bacterium]|nr:HAMP domain-containing sensor histidine kinase [Patescibacteria group bacterium]